MTTEAMLDRERLGSGEVPVPLAPRASWSATLAGAVTMLAVGALLWALALSIVALSSSSVAPTRGNVLALWICAMVATLLGAIAGGYAAGFFSRQIWPATGALHGFLAWCVALLAASLVQFSVAKTLWTTMAEVVPGGPVGSVEAPEGSFAAPDDDTPRSALGQRSPGQHLLVALSWSWFGTWFVAAVLATAAGAMGARSVRRTRPSRPGPAPEPRLTTDQTSATTPVSTPVPSH